MTMTDGQFEEAVDEIFYLFGNGKTEEARQKFEALKPELRRRGYLPEPSEQRSSRGLGRL